jgi:hypothetical protein
VSRNHHLNALDAVLHVGRRGAARLAGETTLPPKVAIEELVAHAEAKLAEIRAELLPQALADEQRAAEDRSAIERLKAELESRKKIREDEHGPFHADRLWISTLLALLIAAAATSIGLVLASGAFESRRPDLVLVLALAAVAAFVAGDWAGRARSWRPAAAALAIVGVAIAATCAVGVHHDQRSPNLLVDLTVVLVVAGAGVLAGRAHRHAPAIRGAEQDHRLEREIHLATEKAQRSEKAVEANHRAYAPWVDRVSASVTRAVEEYLRRLDDDRIADGLFDETDHAAVRTHAQAFVAAWPRELDLRG